MDGRWNRYDPTAMIAPQRIEQGMQDLMSQDASVWGRVVDGMYSAIRY